MTKYTEVEWDAITAAQWAAETVVENLRQGRDVAGALGLAKATEVFEHHVEEGWTEQGDREEWVPRYHDTLYGCLTDLDNYEDLGALATVLEQLTEQQVKEHAA